MMMINMICAIVVAPAALAIVPILVALGLMCAELTQ